MEQEEPKQAGGPVGHPKAGGICVHQHWAGSAPAGLRPVQRKGHHIELVRGPEQSPSLPKHDFTFIFSGFSPLLI